MKLTHEDSILSRAIADRENAIDMLIHQTADKASALMSEILLQGGDLMRMKSRRKHGEWEIWLAKYYTKSARTAQQYMHLASRPEFAAKLINAGSIRKSLLLLNDESSQQKTIQKWPFYTETISRAAKLRSYFDRTPLEQWPAEPLHKLREDLLPVAAKLWPDKFEAPATPGKESIIG